MILFYVSSALNIMQTLVTLGEMAIHCWTPRMSFTGLQTFCIDCLETRTPNILSSIYRVVIVKSHDQVCHWKKWNPYITLKLIFKLSETFKLRHNLQNLPAAVHSIANHDGRFPKQNSNLSVFDFDSILLSNVLL